MTHPVCAANLPYLRLASRCFAGELRELPLAEASVEQRVHSANDTTCLEQQDWGSGSARGRRRHSLRIMRMQAVSTLGSRLTATRGLTL